MKKIIGIVCASLGSILLSAALAFGVFTLIKNKNVAETGNVLGVSWYNETDRTFTITTVEELYEFAELSKFYDFKGQTIKLDADLVVNEGNAADWAEDAPAKKWKPINDFAGTFDGQGHTISGLYAKVFGAKLALFTNTNQSCTIKNMKLVNSYFESNGLEGVASFASTGGGKFYQLYSDAILECRGEKVAGLMSMVNKPTKMEECWFDGAIHTTNRDAGGLIDDIYQARVELKHCLFSGTIDQEYTIGGTRTGSICGKIREKGSLIMNDCLATGTLITSKTVYSGALVGVVYSGCQIVTTDCYISSDVYHLLVGDSGEQGTINGRPLQMPSDVLVGTKAYEWTTLNFDKYWAAVEGGTPVLKCFGEKGLSLEGVEKAFDVSWYMPGTYIYEITTLKQLYGLYYLSGGNNFAEHTIKLGADIVVNEGKASNWEKKAPENQWFAINKFAGIFDGQGHTISGVYLNNEMTYQGLFGQVEPEGIVRNLSIKNSYFCNDSDGKLAMMGSVAGEFRGKLENVYSNAIVTSSGTQVGGIFGRTNDNDADEKDDSVVITNCWFDGEVRMKGNGGRHAGGFIGMVVQGDLDISHCLNTGICSAEAVNIGVHLGGFIGNTMNGGVINMTDCLSAGKIEAAYKICVGSVFGRATNEERIINLSNVYATKESYGVTFYGTGEGGVTSAEVNGIVIMIPKKLATGISAYQWTYLDFAKHWAIVQDGTPILKTFAKSAPSVAGYEKMINLDWYKHDKKTYTIKTTEELYGFALLTCGEEFVGKTVQLGADIVVNSGDASTYATTAPEKAWLPIGSTSAYFKGTFDGQGHTISGLYLNTEDTYGGLFAMTGDGSIVKNFRLTNSYFCYSGTTGALLGSVIGDMFGASTLENVYSNAIVVSQGQQAGGLVGRANDKDTESDKTTDKGIIRNCWFDGNFSLKGETTVYGGGIVGRLFRGDLDIEHCLNTGTLSSEAKGRALQFGGIIGAVNEKGTFNLSDSLNVGTVSVTYHNGAGSVIGRVSCTNQDDRTVNVKDTYGVAESYKTPFGSYSATSNINGVPIPLKEKFMTGYTAYQWTSLDFADNWAIVEGDTPILQNFASSVPSVAGQEKMIDLDWYKASAKTYEINTAKELRGFAVMACGDTFKGKTVMLKDNIDLEEEQWISIGSELKNFSGTFDGQGKTISGLKIDTKEYYGGLFGIAGSGSVIKNFRLTDSDISYSGTGGAILGSVVADLYGGATLENVYSNATVVSCGEQAGGLVGRVNDKDDDKKEDKAIISNCWYAGKFSLTGEATVYGGGIVGRLFRGDLDIEHCLNTGSVSSEAKGKALQLGGFVGAVNGVGSLNVRDSLSIGALSVKHDVGVGSVIGRVASDNPKDRTVNITDTYASADSYKIVLGTSKEHISKGGAAPMPKSFLTGYTAYQWTSLDFEDRWAVVEDGTPVLQTFASKVPSLLGYSKLFDLEWYDADASKFELKTEKELRGLALISATDDFNGKTITLEEDMDLKDKDWLPIGSSFTAFAGTFDGQMKTIKGVHVDTTTAGAGLFGIIASAGNVANFYLTDSTFKSTKTELGSVAGYSAGTISTVYSDADIVSSEKNSGGIVGKISNSATVEKCWFAGDIELSGAQGKQSGGIAGYVANAGANVSITDCLYTGSLTFTATSTNWALRIGGIMGGAQDYYTPTITLENCVSAGTVKHSTNSTNIYAVSAVYGGFDEYKMTKLNLANVYATNGSCGVDRIYHQYKAAGSTSTDATKAPIIDGAGVLLDKFALEGVSGYQNTDLDFVNTWAARTGEVPGLKVFNEIVTESLELSNVVRPDKSWYKEEEVRQEILDEADMYGFMKLMAEGNNFAGKEVYLMNDLENMNEVKADSIAKWKAGTEVPNNKWISSTKFAGTLDGQMHTIKGIYLNTTAAGGGLFGEITATGIVRNLYITDSLFKSTNKELGSVAGYSAGTISTVYSDADIVSSEKNSGGIVGKISNSATVEKCWFAGDIELSGAQGKQSGGITGYVANAGANVSITDCLYTGSLTFTATSTNWALRIGGIIGGAHDYYTPTITLENCVSAGTVKHSTNSTNIYAVSAVYGGFDEYRVTKLNLVNVYATNGSCGVDRIYHQYKAADSTSTDATKAPKITGKGILKNTDALVGLAGYQNTLLDFEDTWVARKDNVPGLVAFTNVLGETVSIANVEQNNWYDANETVFGIGSASALKSLATYTNATNKLDFKGKMIYLTDDIEVNKVESGTLAAWKAGTGTLPTSWTPIGQGISFYGTFDGRHHTISGIYMKVTNNTNTSRWTGYGLFARTASSSTLKNFSLVDSYFQVYDSNGNTNDSGYIANLGSVVGYHHGWMYNIYSNATIVSNRKQVGGIMGCSNSREVNNIWYDGAMTLTTGHGREVGGIIGVIESNNTFSNMLFTGNITFDANRSDAGIGGIVGITYSESTHTPKLKNVVVAGKLKKSQWGGDQAVGSVVGLIYKSTVTVENVYATTDTWGTTYNIASGGTGTISGTITTLIEANLYGDLAKTNAPNLDYTNAWATRTGNVPQLKIFIK